ncbi:MAG: hypothetical protein K0R67_1184 [Paenibacillus sp.]|nr:hypothetical protein [Paenibacillus sp.]
MQNIHEKLRIALLEIERLKLENDQLRDLLKDLAPEVTLTPGHTIKPLEDKDAAKLDEERIEEVEVEVEVEAAGVHQLSSVSEKIRLFRSLFRGREDVSQSDGTANKENRVIHRLVAMSGQQSVINRK